MSVALRVEGVSKQYRIYPRPSDRLKESLTRGLWKRHREFWALKEISFELETGTTTGIIGPNGCGKSTLLQIIAGTLEPTHGAVWHEGRIAAMLELGAGFNMEFTGLENVFMSAALMGFSRRETERRLPEIIRFAEIGDFLNQPVKTYSSGMYVRLAFAVAVCSDPRLLLVDEALAVGDAVFQHRCLRRIKELQEGGATILFVSHDTAAVRALCSRAILLNAGRVSFDGSPKEAMTRYQKLIMAREEAYEAEQPTAETADSADAWEALPPLRCAYRHGDGSAEVISAELLDAGRRPLEVIETGEPVLVRMRTRFLRDVEEPVFGFLLRSRHGAHAYGTNTKEQQMSFETVRRGEVIEVSFSFECWLAPEAYSISFTAHTRDGVSFDWLDDVLFCRVTSPIAVEGIANLNASATARRLGASQAGAAGQAEVKEAATIRG